MAANVQTYAEMQAALQTSAASDVYVGARAILLPAALEIPSGHQDTIRANRSFGTPVLRANRTDRLFRVYGSLTLEDLTLEGGRTLSMSHCTSPYFDCGGGAVHVYNNGAKLVLK